MEHYIPWIMYEICKYFDYHPFSKKYHFLLRSGRFSLWGTIEKEFISKFYIDE